MKDVFEIISKDDELRKLFMEILKWRASETLIRNASFCGPRFSLNAAVNKFCDKLYEKYKVDVEVYT